MNCNHEEHITIHDKSSGDQICTGCGTVLEAFAFEEYCDDFSACTVTKESIKHSETIRNLGHLLRLPDSIITMATTLLIEAQTQGGLRIRQSTINTISASALYYACKLEDADRAEVEIIANCNVTPKQLATSNKLFRRALSSSPWAAKISAPANPLRLIPRFLDVLCSEPAVIRQNDKHRVRRASEDIGHCAEERGVLQGKSPECCCITFIYTALQELGYPESIINEVCLRCGLTPNTIGNASTILKNWTM
jgi:transcription initiation factor TFIIIB Brf1 subunit/transcription initiation factor TFIIB